MITYSRIGHFGRLGNQMFQFASTYGIAKKREYEVFFPVENSNEASVEDFKDGVSREVYFDLPNIFELDQSVLKNKEDIKVQYSAQERFFHFDENFFNIPDGCDLGGYFQSEKYFEHCKDGVKKLFTFKPKIKVEALTKFPKVLIDTVSIHVRVGDYAGLQNFHPICEPEYYQKALLEHFSDKNYMFLIFSDDIEYCKNIFEESENIRYIQGNSAEVDLCMMSICEHNIIANSSFSWWAAWLNSNPEKRVIAPKKWFGPSYHFHNTADLYCKDWITI